MIIKLSLISSQQMQNHIYLEPNTRLIIPFLLWIGGWVLYYKKIKSNFVIPSHKIHKGKKYLYRIALRTILISSLAMVLGLKIPTKDVSYVIDISPSVSQEKTNLSKINTLYRSTYSFWKNKSIILIAGLPYSYCDHCNISALDDLHINQDQFTGELYGSAMGDGLLMAYRQDKNMKIIGITDMGTNKWSTLSGVTSYIWKDNILLLQYDQDSKSNIEKIRNIARIVDLTYLSMIIWIISHLILLSLYLSSIWKLKHSYDTLS